ncbi:MAG: cob(I)yrinic acid a,c-diamide adenosyltransferase, partial [Candidatus Omnitrophica bacterium]|nr:cob(I)yrinic acid a,c-diamide adenosyltransferase [Candidatus Omnitrophota bacterium]
MKQKGLVQIYTGEGKGKTTAAVGLAVRAVSRGLRVCYVSFHKDPKKYGSGEQKILKKIGISVRCFAKAHPFCCKKDEDINRLAGQCRKGVACIRKMHKRQLCDMLVLDEINICVRDGFLAEEEVIGLMRDKPENMELVLTGRGATAKMIKAADMVTYMKEIKHPYKKGV